MPLLEVQAAALAAAASRQGNDDLVITDWHEFLGPAPPVVRNLVEASAQPADSVVSHIAPGVREIRSDLPFDIRGLQIEHVECARLEDMGVPITTPLETEPWGERYLQVTDPNGVVSSSCSG